MSKQRIDKLIDDESFQSLKKSLQEFNIFEATGLKSQEIHHSYFLYFLLNPQKKHGLGSSFLKLFITCVLNQQSPSESVSLDINKLKKKMGSKDLKNTMVERERPVNSDRLDIFIVNEPQEFYCLIENKINSSQGSGQLAKYRRGIKEEFNKKYTPLYVFLTLNDEPPAIAEQPYWIPFNYSSLEEMLSNFRKSQSISQNIPKEIDYMIEQYCMFLRRDILNDSTEDQLCKKLWADHEDVLNLIFQHSPAFRRELFNKMNALVEAKKDVFRFCKTVGRSRRLHFTALSWDEKLWQSVSANDNKDNLYFTFETNTQGDKKVFLELGINKSSDSEIVTKIMEKIQGHIKRDEVMVKPKILKRGKVGETTRLLRWDLLDTQDLHTYSHETARIVDHLEDKWEKIMSGSDVMKYLLEGLPNDFKSLDEL